ncbi:hypothetical protein HYW54_05160 [Candidatus Gottesmanbacteria bacterium]|nr:hypothetical protein [Candidatus Gottesmanbacteria bacterium]
MLRRPEIAVFSNRFTLPVAKKLVDDAHINAFHVDVSPSQEFRMPNRDFEGGIVVGGEGTIRPVVHHKVDYKINRPLGIYAKGTNNVLMHTLEEAHRILDASEFTSHLESVTPDRYAFYPGKVGGIVFTNQAGFGPYEQAVGDVNRVLRMVPKNLRQKLARILALVPASFTSQNKIDMGSVLQYIGKIRAFPKQDPFGEELTHAWIGEGFQDMKLVLTLLFWSFDLPAPKGLLHTESVSSFVAKPGKKIWFDGDTNKSERFFPQSGEVIVSRSDYPITIAALT